MIEMLIRGGWVMLPILMASVVSVTFVIERVLFYLRLRSPISPEELLSLVGKGKADQALKKSEGIDAPAVRVIREGLLHGNSGYRFAMEAKALEVVKEMRKNLSALDTIITLAPLLGLLGTIVGMIQSFGIISEVGLGDPNAVTGGVAEALIATAAGITVAVATLVPYNYFLSHAERAEEEMEIAATKMEMLLEKSETRGGAEVRLGMAA